MEDKAIKEKEEGLLNLYSALTERLKLSYRTGQQYDGNRDLFQALGYPRLLEYQSYSDKYRRQDIAKAIINKPVDYTWRGPLVISESSDDEVTQLEVAWEEAYDRLSLKNKFKRLDKLSSLGRYAVLFLGFSDVATAEDFRLPVLPSSSTKLLYVQPLSENKAVVESLENSPISDRYGLPKFYNVSLATGDNTSRQVLIHHSRVIHVPGEILESEWEGIPVLESVYNRLHDLEKLVGASAEMFWRGGRPGYKGKVDPEFSITPEVKEDLQSQLDEYEHNLRRVLAVQGIDFEALATQVADPSKHVEVQVQMISAVTGIPKRILTGSERGELASTEDKDNWLDTVQSRREELVEPQIVVAFVDRMIELKIFPEAKEKYTVVWQDLYAPSDKDKAEVGKIRTTSLKEYVTNPAAQAVIPPEAFLNYLLGLSTDEAEYILEMAKAYRLEVEEEEEDLEDDEKKILEEEEEEEDNE